MVSTKTISEEAHKFLNNYEGIDDYFKAIEALVGIVLLKKEIKDSTLVWYNKLMKHYNNPALFDYKDAVDECIAYLQKKYINETIRYANGDTVKGKELFRVAKQRLNGKQVVKRDEETF